MTGSDRPGVGFIGFEGEGAAIARAIADSGYVLHVWAATPGALDALESVPNRVHPRVTELAAASDIVGLFLDDAENVRIALDEGLLANLRSGAVLVNHANGLPEEARQLAEIAAGYGIGFVDAPVSGGPAAAQARELTTIAGGAAEVVERLTPMFTTFSTAIVHVGPVGSGQYGKLFNNALMAMNHKNVLEVLRVAVGLGLPVPALLDVLRSGSAASVALEAFGPSITAENVRYLQPAELVDMQLFSVAVAALGDEATPVVDRAFAGARELSELTGIVLG